MLTLLEQLARAWWEGDRTAGMPLHDALEAEGWPWRWERERGRLAYVLCVGGIMQGTSLGWCAFYSGAEAQWRCRWADGGGPGLRGREWVSPLGGKHARQVVEERLRISLKEEVTC